MSEKELREKYGGKLPKAINRAIRAEIPGGNEALDMLTHLSGPAMQSKWVNHAGSPTPEAKAYYTHLRNIVIPMENKVRLNWDIRPGSSFSVPKTEQEKANAKARFQGKSAGGKFRRPKPAGAKFGGAKFSGAKSGGRKDVGTKTGESKAGKSRSWEAKKWAGINWAAKDGTQKPREPEAGGPVAPESEHRSFEDRGPAGRPPDRGFKSRGPERRGPNSRSGGNFRSRGPKSW